MKKCICLLLILCLFCACGKKTPEPSPAPLPEITGEPESSAEPAVEPESTAEPAAEAESSPAPEPEAVFGEGPPPEPEDLEQAGLSEPAFEPVEVLSGLTDGQRTDLNVFLSNFSELNFPNFKRDSFDTATAVNFAYMHNKINSFGRDKIDVRQWNGESCYSISTKDVDACLERFLGIQISHEGFEMDMHQIGCDGERYYFPAADGEAFNTFTVVNFMNRMADGKTIAVSFDIYDLDYEVYWDTGLEDKYYAMTPEEAESCGVLTRRGEGTADLEEYVYHGVSTYRLLYYWSIP